MRAISTELSHRYRVFDDPLTSRPKGSRLRRRVWAARLSLAAALAVGLAYFPYGLVDGSSERKAAELRAQHEHMTEMTRRLAEENARLRLEIHALENEPSALEEIARKELGMVYPGELIIRIERQP